MTVAFTSHAQSISSSPWNQTHNAIEPSWHIFNLCLQKFEVPIIHSLLFTHPTTDNPSGPTIITLECAGEENDNFMYTAGASAFPPLLSHTLQAGISKFDTCDYSVQLFYRYIEHALEEKGAVAD